MSGQCAKLVPDTIEEALSLMSLCPENKPSKILLAYYFMKSLMSTRTKDILSNKEEIIIGLDALSIGAIFSLVFKIKNTISDSDPTKSTIDFLMKSLSIDESIPIYSMVINSGITKVDPEKFKKELIYFYHMMSAHKTYIQSKPTVSEISSAISKSVESDQRYWRTTERLNSLRCIYYSLVSVYPTTDSYVNDIGSYLLNYDHPWYMIKYHQNQIKSLVNYIKRLNNSNDLHCIFALKYIRDKLSIVDSSSKIFPTELVSSISYPGERLEKGSRNILLNVFSDFSESDISRLDNNLRNYLIKETESIIKSLTYDTKIESLNNDSFNVFFINEFAKLYYDVIHVLKNKEDITIFSLIVQFNQLEVALFELTKNLNKQISVLERVIQETIRPNLEDVWDGNYNLWSIIESGYNIDLIPFKYIEPFDTDINNIVANASYLNTIKYVLLHKFSKYSNVVINLFTNFEQLKLYNPEDINEKEYLIFPVFQEKVTGKHYGFFAKKEVLLNLYVIKKEEDDISITVVNFNDTSELLNLFTEELILLYNKFSPKSNNKITNIKQIMHNVKSFSMYRDINKSILYDSLLKNTFIFVIWYIECTINGLSGFQISNIDDIFGEGKYFNYIIKNYYIQSIQPYFASK